MNTKPPFQPLLLNPVTNEPYLPLEEPFHNIIITPPRPDTDAEAIVPTFNDPRVHTWCPGTKIPYTLEHAANWIKLCKKKSDSIFEELRRVESDNEQELEHQKGPTDLKLVSGCPVRIIREVKEDGNDVYIGNVGCMRNDYWHIVDRDEAARLTEVNYARKLGDPEILWHMGDYLAPSHHGRGIMTAAVHALIHGWMVPRMGVKHISVNMTKGNAPSVRVFEKNGFKLIGRTIDCKEMPEERGGGKYGLHVMEWRAEWAESEGRK